MLSTARGRAVSKGARRVCRLQGARGCVVSKISFGEISGGILAEELAERGVQLGMPLAQGARAFEECFGDNREEFGRVRGAIDIEHGGSIRFRGGAQRFEFLFITRAQERYSFRVARAGAPSVP